MRVLKLAIYAFLPIVLLIETGARFYWDYREREARTRSGTDKQQALALGNFEFIKEPDAVLGYRLKRSLDFGKFASNPQGFAQRDAVSLARKPDSLRIVAMGDSTTGSVDVDTSYPTQLRQILLQNSAYAGSVDVINAGVGGWTSDQSALWAKIELAAYRPDVVFLYVGWNDFQSYTPLGPPPRESYFAQVYGHRADFIGLGSLRSIQIAAHWGEKLLRAVEVDRSPPNLFLPDPGGWAALQGAKVRVSEDPSPQGFGGVGFAELPPNGYVYAGIAVQQTAKLADGQPITASLYVKGRGAAAMRLNGLESPWPLYRECPAEPISQEWKQLSCTIAKPHDGHGLQVSLRNTSAAPTSVTMWGPMVSLGSEAVANAPRMSPATPEETYRFLIDSLDRILAAFRATNPDVKFAMGTLVGPWPLESDAVDKDPKSWPWWAYRAGVPKEQMVTLLDRFNDVIRHFAATRGVLLIDSARDFEPLNRPALMTDFAHMTPDGYRLMAELIAKGMIDAGWVNAKPPADFEGLRGRYTRSTGNAVRGAAN